MAQKVEMLRKEGITLEPSKKGEGSYQIGKAELGRKAWVWEDREGRGL